MTCMIYIAADATCGSQWRIVEWEYILHFKVVLAAIFIKIKIYYRKIMPFSQFYNPVTSKWVPLTDNFYFIDLYDLCGWAIIPIYFFWPRWTAIFQDGPPKSLCAQYHARYEPLVGSHTNLVSQLTFNWQYAIPIWIFYSKVSMH